jgi:hypothetical protein
MRRSGDYAEEIMMKQSLFRAVVCALFLSSICIGATTPESLDVKFDPRGIASIKYGNTELLANGTIELRKRVTMKGTDLSNQPINEPKISFDPASNRLDETYDWGVISCGYTIDGNSIFLDVAVHNTSTLDIRVIEMSVLRLKLPGWAEAKKWETRWPQAIETRDDPQIVPVNYDSGTLLFCGEDVTRSIGLHVLPEKIKDEYSLVLREEGMPRMDGAIGAGDSREFKLSVRLGPKGSAEPDLASDIFSRFAEQYPSELNWKDRRPIGSINIS